MKPLNQQETDQLLVLLRKLWKHGETESTIARIAKNLFIQITQALYEKI